jgi:type I restriction enzyme, S subunit
MDGRAGEVTGTKFKHACVDGGQYGLNIAASDYVDDGVRLLRTSDLSPNGTYVEDGIFVSGPVEPRFIVQAGDLLLSRSGTVGQAFAVPTALAGCSFAGFLIRFRVNPSQAHPRFMYYVTQSQGFQSAVESDAITSTISNFNADRYANIPIPLPPLAEQARIAAFLDYQATRIDSIIDARRQQIGLLAEHHSALRIRLTSRGSVEEVAERSSGLPWCPTVNADWRIVPTRAVLSLRQDLVGSGWESFNLLSLTKQGVIPRDIESNEGKFPASFETYQAVEPGDLIFCLFDVDETPRTVGLVAEPGMLTGAYTRFAVNRSLVSPDYLVEYFIGVDDRKAFRPLYTGMRKTIQKDRFLSAGLPLPTLPEQTGTVKTLTESRLGTVGLTESLVKSIGVLQEYKRSLITSAVSGEFDVSAASGRGVPA